MKIITNTTPKALWTSTTLSNRRIVVEERDCYAIEDCLMYKDGNCKTKGTHLIIKYRDGALVTWC